MPVYFICVAVAAALLASQAEAGSCHGTAKQPQKTVVAAAPVEVDVVIEETVCEGPTCPQQTPKATAAQGVSVLDARRNANREARAAKHAAVQSRRAARFSAKAGEAAAQAEIDTAVRKAYE